MKKIFFPILALSFAGIEIFTSCKKTGLPPHSNQPPVANAGADQVITLPTDSVELTGIGADPDGIITGYKWTTISGPSLGTILHPDAAMTTVKSLVAGTYQFELKVTDNGGLSATDKVAVLVKPWSDTVRSIGKYQSKQTGRWRDASSWKRYDGASWVDAMEPPSGDTVQVNILGGHIITVDSTAEVGKVMIDTLGTLTIESDFTFTDELTNNGTLNWQDGTIKMLGVYSFVVTLINNGNFLIKGNNGTSSYWWDSDVRIVNNGILSKSSTGPTSLDAAHSFTNTSHGVIQGIGTLSASGNIWWVPGFIDGGTIAPGLPLGILTINNVLYPFSSGSVLQVQVLDNSGPGTGHDQLVSNSDITLAGKLAVTEVGSSVAKGRFTIITTTGVIKDKFSSIDLPPGYSLQINGSSVELVKQ